MCAGCSREDDRDEVGGESGVSRSRLYAVGSGSRQYAAGFALPSLALWAGPAVPAHTVTDSAGLSEMHAILLVLAGLALVGGAVALKRRDRLSPTASLGVAFAGIVAATTGAILFDALSSDLAYTASSMPFPREWYPVIGLFTGLGIAVGSLVVGLLRWPTRPRYTFLGILLGLWISYPYLVPGAASVTHPLGYAIVLATPVLVGYVLWTDAGGVVRAILRDPVARWFGVGVGVVVALFFLAITGYLSVFPEEGMPHETTVVVLPVIYQLVSWPTLEIVLPHIPFFVAVSPGVVVVVGLLSSLVGLNAAVIARHWRVEEPAGLTEGTAGTAAVVGSCTCGCCGPLVAKVAVLAAGPSVAAPLYWVFVDSDSPLNTLFLVGSIVLFTGSLVYSIESARQADRSVGLAPAD
jgi:hypothetical protein